MHAWGIRAITFCRLCCGPPILPLARRRGLHPQSKSKHNRSRQSEGGQKVSMVCDERLKRPRQTGTRQWERGVRAKLHGFAALATWFARLCAGSRSQCDVSPIDPLPRVVCLCW